MSNVTSTDSAVQCISHTPRLTGGSNRKDGNKRKREKLLWGYLFISPAIIGILVFVFVPMLFSLFTSFTNWDMMTPMKWVGIENYKNMFTSDMYYWKSLRVTLYFTLLNVPAVNIIAMLLAVLLNQKIKARSIFRTVFYIPSIVPLVANTALWMFMFNPSFGFFNEVLGFFNIPPQTWIWNEQEVIPCLALMSAWGAGNTMIVYLAGLQGVPRDLYEAVDIDGGGAISKFFNVTVPMTSPIIFYNVVICMVGSMQFLTQGYIMTKGGPNNASLFYVLLLYRTAFTNGQMGYASAMAWVLFIIIAALSALAFKSSNIFLFYESKVDN